ncbi:hypothetical protein LCI54_000002 [Campylobacter jejuni]|nr:hypothetical protein [Campylobacter jejuni]EAL1699932.1 hypothetical protein [Campylobacter jejuni]EID8542167.1 hypothetical protein [Campylobacter jejuni]
MYITIDKIAEFLTSKSRVCLTINGHWGIGKTHLWKQVEEKINADKKVVYIDLFGKESYKQILEEIVFKIHQNYNKTVNVTSRIISKTINIKSAGIININPDAIFSFLKKEDFNNIIVCFDNIERRSDNLSLKEILGLVNLLKEDKGGSDADFKNKIENILQIRDNKLEVFAKDLNSEKFLKTIYWFKQIIKSDQEVSEEYKKGYFEKIDKIIQILIKEQYPYYSKRIKLLIAFSKQCKKIYSEITKKHNNEDKLKIFKYNIKEYPHIFHFVNIDKFNQYEIKSIKDAFYNDKYFLKNFIDFFRLVPKKNPIPKGDHNLNRYTDTDSKEYEKIFKKNNLFLAFIEYINENKYKKQIFIKDRRVNNDKSNILSKLFYL